VQAFYALSVLAARQAEHARGPSAVVPRFRHARLLQAYRSDVVRATSHLPKRTRG
jgi:hypothetical protein